MSEWNGWIYKVCDEVWCKVRPYLVEVLVHFVIFCLTMLVVVLILAISWWIVPFCENTLEEDPFVIRVLVGASDLLIIVHFALYLWHCTSL